MELSMLACRNRASPTRLISTWPTLVDLLLKRFMKTA
jgi:hypothetical protein